MGWFVFLMLNFMHSLYMFNINLLSDVSEDANIFSQSVGGLFVLLTLSFVVQELFGLM